MDILVCGGAGYIGSHMVKMLHSSGHRVVTFDNLSTGHSHAVKWGEFVQGDLLNAEALDHLFQNHHFDAVMHFSARSQVGESVLNPSLYYRNNVIGSYNLINTMCNHGVKKLIFSSTASVYGNPESEQIDENHPLKPINPYGHTKRMVETILEDFATGHGFNSVSLRYFNAAGADSGGELGEEHDPETHLIPNVLKSALGSGNAELKIFGDDYETPDGTCIRDYIHVEDLCSAHLKALEYLNEHPGANAFNLGSSQGFSVKQILQAAEAVVGHSIAHEVLGRRAGDPAILIANSSKARRELGWEPQYTDIKEIIATAWKWMSRHRNMSTV